jgi:hypothetical protein
LIYLFAIKLSIHKGKGTKRDIIIDILFQFALSKVLMLCFCLLSFDSYNFRDPINPILQDDILYKHKLNELRGPLDLKAGMISKDGNHFGDYPFIVELTVFVIDGRIRQYVVFHVLKSCGWVATVGLMHHNGAGSHILLYIFVVGSPFSQAIFQYFDAVQDV